MGLKVSLILLHEALKIILLKDSEKKNNNNNNNNNNNIILLNNTTFLASRAVKKYLYNIILKK